MRKEAEASFVVYVIRSERDGGIYTGSTSDLDRRLHEHNNGNTRSTRGRGPWKLVHTEYLATKEEAEARERYFKSGSGREKIHRILNRQKENAER
ncbi:MAG TPA: GIY-YIG nuclease family protein [Bacteroidota bacterium]|nr:GIY-YIG nuclease family protein [Bacteroidota bacterium]